MKTIKLIFLLLIATFAVACGQPDKTFKEQITVEKGIRFGDGTIQLTALTGGTTYWNDVLSKPLTFPPATHNHNTLYKPLTWVPVWGEISEKPIFFSESYNDLTDKPGTIELAEALSQLGYLPVPGQTTAAINAIVVPAGEGGIVKDITLDCYKIWSNGAWRILPTTN